MVEVRLPEPSGLLSHDESSLLPEVAPSSAQSPENLALLDMLREAVATGSKSTDAILRAVAEAAGVLSGAHGTALALRQEGVIVCRARSGDIAPPLGSPLSADSGISGECLRTATILVCDDADTDDRVDPEVCRSLGVRSIAVVPLRGRIGMIGILEAFSAQAGAFEKPQIDSLRALAEIAESAYERELRERTLSLAGPGPAKVRPASLPAAATDSRIAEHATGLTLKRGYWIIGAVALAVMLITIVVRMSWRQTGADIAASEPSSQTRSSSSDNSVLRPVPASLATSASSSLPAQPLIAAVNGKPSSRRQPEQPPAASLIQKAAEISPASDQPDGSGSAGDAVAPASSADQPPTTSSGSDVPPSVEFARSSASGDLASMATGSAQLPAFGGSVSQGITEANLLRKVDPIYPAKAREQKIAGPVTLDATIAEDGSVRAVTPVSGPPILADAAAAAVRQWRYRPAALNGKPVQIQKQITVVFKLP